MTEAYETARRAVDYKFYILQVSACTSEGQGEDAGSDAAKTYLKAGYMAEIDKYLATHGAYAPLYGVYSFRLQYKSFAAGSLHY